MSWDTGVRWYLTQSSAQAANPEQDPLALDVIRDQHLRVTNGSVEDEYLEHLRTVSLEEAERVTRRALLPQTWVLHLDRFPCGPIVLPKPPLIGVTSIAYVDENGDAQSLDSSPTWWRVEQPSGPVASKARIFPAYDEVWPSVRPGPGAVTVTFEAGYVTDGSPAVALVPTPITHGRLVFIAELYKQRSESVRTALAMSARAADRFWRRYTVYEP